jgi:hypothetical protein
MVVLRHHDADQTVLLCFRVHSALVPIRNSTGAISARNGLVVVLGVVAGALIWMKRKPGIVLAHVALVARIVMILVVLVFLAMLYQAASGWPWYRTLRYYGAPPWAEIAFNIACILYLRTSRRLKATLHLEQPPANAGSAS